MMTAQQQRKNRTRAKIAGSTSRPRLSVKVTNKHITAQVINDETGTTVVYVTTVKNQITGSMTDKAVWAGTAIAKAATDKKVTTVVFDRGSKIYHGRLHALAEAARQAGLEF